MLVSPSAASSLPQAILCDFDGTITAVETFVAVLKRFAPEVSARLLPEMYARRLTLRQGVQQVLESIPSACYPDIVEFTRQQPVRPGLAELLDWLARRQIPFVVVSGGLRGMVEAVVQPWRDRIHAIHAVDIDASGDYLRPSCEFMGDTDFMDKVQVMQKYAPEFAVAIGDSVTDLNLALAAPLVFARDRLAQYLQDQHKPFVPWNDFLDVRDYLNQHWSDCSQFQ